MSIKNRSKVIKIKILLKQSEMLSFNNSAMEFDNCRLMESGHKAPLAKG